jgi:excinuclease UvrABC ATPase subunit
LLGGSALPGHVRRLDLAGIRQVVQIDASPIGQNARSTPATYSGAFDQIRRVFAGSAHARRRRWKPGHFSFNTREGQSPAAGSATSTSTSSTCPTSPSAARAATAPASTTPP